MKIQPMSPNNGIDTECARLIYELCHPSWPQKSDTWFFANPTLLVFDDDGGVIAHASFSVDMLSATMRLMDTCVLPAVRGRGIARKLMEEREAIGRTLGVTTFIGCTWEANVAIRRIHEALGYHACQRVPGYFAHNNPPADGIVYIKAGLTPPPQTV